MGALLISTSLFAVCGCVAADAFFSADGKSVTYIPGWDTGCLKRLQLDTRKVDTIAFDEAFKASLPLSIAAGAEGQFLVLTDKDVWMHDADGWRKDCSVEGVKEPRDLTMRPGCARGKEELFVIGRDPGMPSRTIFFTHMAGQQEWRPVLCRRVGSVAAGEFAADGRFFFAGEEDVWEGAFAGGLEATRIAPVAFKNTDIGNAGNMRTDQVVSAGEGIYVALSGHHMGAVLRLQRPKQTKLGEGGDLKEHYSFLAQNLSSVQVIEERNDPFCKLAATSAGGHERLFYGYRSHMYLWDKDTGKTEEVATESP